VRYSKLASTTYNVSRQFSSQSGFTLIELIMVIVILGILSAFVIPRFSDLSSAARIATLEGIKGAMRSTISIIRSQAYVKGLSISASNPEGQQADYIVETEAGTSEVDWRNLCPESRAELGDALSMPDHIDLSESAGLTSIVSNRYTRVGYDIQGSGAATANGCYVTYDSFGDPDCTVSVIITDC
jgi:MSHA pilin protein MshA